MTHEKVLFIFIQKNILRYKNYRFIRTAFTAIFITAVFCHQARASMPFEGITFSSNSSILVADENLEPIYAWQPNKLLIPASTQKILTSLMALETWGRDYRFRTKFYLAEDWLWVKGYGDPFLISEEIDIIAKAVANQLASRGQVIRGIGIDSSYFAKFPVPGRTDVDDPYNAPLSAVSANFNTVYVNKKNLSIESAEIQTPLTPTAEKVAGALSDGKYRINLGDSTLAEQHFAELLRAKLIQYGLNIEQNILLEETPRHSTLIYEHKNSHSLEKILKASLQYSNNFIANQLFIALSADDEYGSLKGYQQWAKTFLLQRYSHTKNDWQSVVIEEGAGLSRNNRLSAQHLLHVLSDFQPYKSLLKEYKNGQVRAKTGTLKNVRTFAGYIHLNDSLNNSRNNSRNNDSGDDNTITEGKKYYFVFLLNDPEPYKYRETLLTQLVDHLKKF